MLEFNVILDNVEDLGPDALLTDEEAAEGGALCNNLKYFAIFSSTFLFFFERRKVTCGVRGGSCSPLIVVSSLQHPAIVLVYFDATPSSVELVLYHFRL